MRKLRKRFHSASPAAESAFATSRRPHRPSSIRTLLHPALLIAVRHDRRLIRRASRGMAEGIRFQISSQINRPYASNDNNNRRPRLNRVSCHSLPGSAPHVAGGEQMLSVKRPIPYPAVGHRWGALSIQIQRSMDVDGVESILSAEDATHTPTTEFQAIRHGSALSA